MKPLAVFLAGANGSGKSSLRDWKVDNDQCIIIDPDRFIKTNNGNNILGSRQAISVFKKCISEKTSFSLETTLAGKSAIKRIENARNAGFRVKMHYIGLNSPELNIRRVAERVARGGHDIPRDSIIERYNSSRENLIQAVDFLDRLEIYDNSEVMQLDLILENSDFCYINPAAKPWSLVIKEKIETKLPSFT